MTTPTVVKESKEIIENNENFFIPTGSLWDERGNSISIKFLLPLPRNFVGHTIPGFGTIMSKEAILNIYKHLKTKERNGLATSTRQ